MYKKYLVVASKKDFAGIGITTALSQFRGNPFWDSLGNKASFDFYLVDDEILYENNLDLEKISKYDFVIFASKHASDSSGKIISLHAPGNFRTADFGGVAGKVCRASALFQKQLFEILDEKMKEHNLSKYKLTLEVTHHGPLIDKPCVFVEVGSGEEEWKDRRASFVVATAIRDIIEKFEENSYREITVGIGGGHYCSVFNKLQEDSNVAFAHIIPNYVFPLSVELIKETINKTEEEIDFFILDWKSMTNEDERNRIVKILDDNYIAWKKVSDVKN